MKKEYRLKNGRRGSYETLRNGLEFKFRGGCDALGPEANSNKPVVVVVILMMLMLFVRCSTFLFNGLRVQTRNVRITSAQSGFPQKSYMKN